MAFLNTTATHDEEPMDMEGHVADGDATVRISNDAAENGYEQEPGALTWLNSARITTDPDDDAVHCVVSIGDPRGGFCFTVRRLRDGRIVLHLPDPSDGMAHMPTRELHTGTLEVCNYSCVYAKGSPQFDPVKALGKRARDMTHKGAIRGRLGGEVPQWHDVWASLEEHHEETTYRLVHELDGGGGFASIPVSVASLRTKASIRVDSDDARPYVWRTLLELHETGDASQRLIPADFSDDDPETLDCPRCGEEMAIPDDAEPYCLDCGATVA